MRIYYSEKTGGVWPPNPEIVSGTSTPASNKFPQLDLDNDGNPHVTWSGWDGASIYRIYYSEKTGAAWSPMENISGSLAASPTDNQNPRITLDTGGNPHVTWTGNGGPFTSVYYSENIKYTISANANPPRAGP